MAREGEKGGRFALPKIGAAPLDAGARRAGPMAVAGRESAEALTRLAEEQAEQRRRNAEEAEAWRRAVRVGLVLERLPLDVVRAQSLPRDRLDLDGVARADAMEELKASIRARGQREAIEVWQVAGGFYELKSGWRRLEALRQLHAETGDERYSTVLARVVGGAMDRAGLYIDMVEENAVREDVSFAELAHVAIAMAKDPLSGVSNPFEAVNRLYGALHKSKRAVIRRFVELLVAAGDLLPVPQAIPKHVGADAARCLGVAGERRPVLRRMLAEAVDAETQNAALAAFVASGETAEAPVASPAVARSKGGERQKFEFHHAGMKVTARVGEVRIRCDEDFVDMPHDRLEAAVAAFRAALRG
jgi:ParB family chromosome partitioning protein